MADVIPVAQVRALMERWRQRAMRQHREGNERDHVRESQSYCYGSEHAYDACADELAALLAGASGAQPEDYDGPEPDINNELAPQYRRRAAAPSSSPVVGEKGRP